MNESENLWNADSLLKLSEELQAENEKYRLKVKEQENQIRTHLSDVQKLKSQIRSMQSTIAEQGQEIQNLNGHIARLAESDLVLEKNKQLEKENRRLLAENGMAQKTLEEAGQKTEDAKRILAEANALKDTFDKQVKDEISRIKRRLEADINCRLKDDLQRQTVTLGIWTWTFCVICLIQTGYILFTNKNVTCLIPRWFVKRWKNVGGIAKTIARLYQWCYGYLTDDLHPYMAVGIMVLASAGMIAGGFLLFRNVFDRLREKWDNLWQYYEMVGVKELRKAVSVALCVISITFATMAAINVPADINVVSWWIGFSVGLNFLYHGTSKNSYY